MKVEEFSTMPFSEIRDAALVRATLICESLTIPVFGELPPPDFTWVILGEFHVWIGDHVDYRDDDKLHGEAA